MCHLHSSHVRNEEVQRRLVIGVGVMASLLVSNNHSHQRLSYQVLAVRVEVRVKVRVEVRVKVRVEGRCRAGVG